MLRYWSCAVVVVASMWPAAPAAARTVDIISCLTENVVSFRATSRGSFGWMSDSRQVIVPGYVLDERVESLIASRLSDARAVLGFGCADLGLARTSGGGGSVEDRLRQMAKRSAADVVIAVVPALSRSGMDESPYRMFGLGLFRCNNYFRADYFTAVFATFRIVAFDARAGVIMSEAYADLHKKVAGSLWPGDDQPMPSDRAGQIGDALEALVLRNLPRTLEKLNSN